jgi:hypothetical protein
MDNRRGGDRRRVASSGRLFPDIVKSHGRENLISRRGGRGRQQDTVPMRRISIEFRLLPRATSCFCASDGIVVKRFDLDRERELGQ